MSISVITYSERETRLLAAAQAFIDATRGSVMDDAFIPWRDLRDAAAAYPLHVVQQQRQDVR